MRRHAQGSRAGFSMVELLVTIVLAGIIFAAMVPLFVNALGETSREAQRNDADVIAQDRIEQVRLLSYADLQPELDKLNNPPSPAFGDHHFGTTYTPLGQRPYHVAYVVARVPSQPDFYKVTVTVTPPSGGHAIIKTTMIKDPAPNIYTVDSGGTTGTLPTTNLSITVTFKDWTDVIQGGAKGVYFTRVDGAGATVTSAHLWPTSATNPKVVFSNLTGGKNYTYRVVCWTTFNGGVSFKSPAFHLLKSARLKFDTNPGGS
jgi:prepilin-type N-terminal cleavage/methylation domain-containing protein